MKYFILILAIVFMGCSNGAIETIYPDVEFYEYDTNICKLECMTMVDLYPGQIGDNNWIIPTGMTLKMEIVTPMGQPEDISYARFISTSTVPTDDPRKIYIEGAGQLVTSTFEVLTPPTDLYYFSIAVWVNDDFALIDYCIDKNLIRED